MMIPPVCIFVHVEYCQLDVGYEQPLLGALLLDVLHEGVPLQGARRQPGVRLLQVGQPDVEIMMMLMLRMLMGSASLMLLPWVMITMLILMTT